MTRRDLFNTIAGAFAGAVAAPAVLEARRSRALIEARSEMLTGQQLALLENLAPRVQLTGPRGCGKTWALARWLADECDKPEFRGLFLTRHGIDHLVDRLKMVRSKDFGRLRYSKGDQCVIWPSGARVYLGRQGDGILDLTNWARAEIRRVAVDDPETYWVVVTAKDAKPFKLASAKTSLGVLHGDITTIRWESPDRAFVKEFVKGFPRYDPDAGGLGSLQWTKLTRCVSPNPPPDALLPCMMEWRGNPPPRHCFPGYRRRRRRLVDKPLPFSVQSPQ